VTPADPSLVDQPGCIGVRAPREGATVYQGGSLHSFSCADGMAVATDVATAIVLAADQPMG
jgi:hypothetical protein